MRPPLLRSAIVALAPLLLLASCNPSTEPPAHGQAHLAVTANVAGTAVATVVVEVTAPDIPTPLVFNFVVADGFASGTITIPAGSNRTITIRAYDAGAVLTHRGTAIVSVQAGTNPTVSLTLNPLSGDVPIEAHLGSFTVNVTPKGACVTIPNKAHVDASNEPAADRTDNDSNTVNVTTTFSSSTEFVFGPTLM